MKLLTAAQIREADQFTIKNEPISSIDLMERAAQKCTNWIINHFYASKNFKIFTGPGNNGGDGLAIARQLSVEGFKSEIFLVHIADKLSDDNQENLSRLKKDKKVSIKEINDPKDFPAFDKEDIIVDAIFGSGLSRETDGLAKEVIKHINKSTCRVISVDMPSGLFSENNTGNNFNSIIKAGYTLTFQIPKISFFFEKENKFTGQVIVIDIGLSNEFIKNCPSQITLIEKHSVFALIKKREIFSHKGNYGHALLIAGSNGKMGAAVLSSKACLKSGCGLLTVHAPANGLNILQCTVPEAMVQTDFENEFISNVPDIRNFNCVGIGPGMGTKTKTVMALKKLLKQKINRLVIDADGLNIISKNRKMLHKLPPETIITPHPKEFERLFGNVPDKMPLYEYIMKCSKQYNIIIVYKEAFTKVATPSGHLYVNQSGNPGMATAGSGDVLTGMILSFLAQNYQPEDAANIAVYLHGLAGDSYAGQNSEESLTAGDLINTIGNAFKITLTDNE